MNDKIGLTIGQREALHQSRSKRLAVAVVIAMVIEVWMLICSVVQLKVAALFISLSLLAITAILPRIFPFVASRRTLILVLSSFAMFAVWEIWTNGSWHSDVPLALMILLLSAMPVAIVAMFLNRPARSWVIAGLPLLIMWIAVSINDHAHLRPRSTVDPRRLVSVPGDDLVHRQRVGLALSGGGYRAALMHAGVLAALEKLGVPVNNIAAVSGGSITAAYYARGGDPEDLVTVVGEGRLNLRRELTHIENVVRLPFPMRLPVLDVALLPFFSYSRSDVQRDLLDRELFDNAPFKTAGPMKGQLQVLYCTTDLLNGALVGISRDGILVDFLTSNGRTDVDFLSAADLAPESFPNQASLSEVVVASGAFPLAFDPRRVRVVRNSRSAGTSVFPAGTGAEFLLADGGLTDNSGERLLSAASELGSKPGSNFGKWQSDLVIASDAGAVFTPEETIQPPMLLGRAIDVVYATATRPADPKVILITPRPYIALFAAARTHDPLLQSYWARRAQPFPELLAIAYGDGAARDIVFQVARSGHRWNFLREHRERVNEFNQAVAARQSDHALAILKVIISGVINDDFRECVETFSRTTTLQDQLTPYDAHSLFRLGEYLVLLKWPVIAARMGRAA